MKPFQHLWCFMLQAQSLSNCLVRFTLATFTSSRAERRCTRNLWTCTVIWMEAAAQVPSGSCWSLEARLDRIRPETISNNFFQYKWASTLRLWYCSTVHCVGQLRGRLLPSSWRREARTMARCVLLGRGGDDDDEMMAREKNSWDSVLSLTQQNKMESKEDESVCVLKILSFKQMELSKINDLLA